MKYVLNLLYPAILITPGSYGVTGFAWKHPPLEKFQWTFLFDEPNKPSIGVARQDIYIPQFDKTRWCPAHTRLHRMETALQEIVEDLTYNRQPLWALKPGEPKGAKKVEIEMLHDIRVSYNDEHGRMKHGTLKDLYETSTRLT
jgi:hypothetical protein